MTATVLAPQVRSLLERASIVRVATVLPDGRPHVAPFWFHFDGERLVLDTLENRTVRNIRDEPRVSVELDLGSHFEEYEQATIDGTARAFAPSAAPTEVRAAVEEIRRRHASETNTAVFEAYAARETRPQVYVEIELQAARWWSAQGA